MGMAIKVTIDEAQARWSDLIEAAISGERIVIANDENQAVRLMPYEVGLTIDAE